MSGPIVRSGPSKEFSDKWGSVFGEKNVISERHLLSFRMQGLLV